MLGCMGAWRPRRHLQQLEELHRVVNAAGARIDVRSVCEVTDGELRFPVYALCLGNPSLAVPAVGFFGGVHGLERVGTQVLLCSSTGCSRAGRMNSVQPPPLQCSSAL